MKEQQEQLQELLDRKACEDVLMRYGRTLDWLDETGHESCFWPDAEIDYGFLQGSGADWVGAVMEIEMASSRRWHVSAGVIVQVRGSQAKSECYGFTVAASANEKGQLVDTMFGGRYLDELEKREGQWRISRRKYIADWVHQFPDGLEAMTSADLVLNVLQVRGPGHELYRQL